MKKLITLGVAAVAMAGAASAQDNNIQCNKPINIVGMEWSSDGKLIFHGYKDNMVEPIQFVLGEIPPADRIEVVTLTDLEEHEVISMGMASFMRSDLSSGLIAQTEQSRARLSAEFPHLGFKMFVTPNTHDVTTTYTNAEGHQASETFDFNNIKDFTEFGFKAGLQTLQPLMDISDKLKATMTGFGQIASVCYEYKHKP